MNSSGGSGRGRSGTSTDAPSKMASKPKATTPTTPTNRVAIARLPDSAGREDRKRIPQACETCRAKKCRCDGAQPVCKRCATNGTPCHYGLAKGLRSKRLLEDLSQKVAVYERLLDGSGPGPATERQTSLHPLQQATSPTTDGESVSSSSVTGKRIQPRPIETARYGNGADGVSPYETPLSATLPYASFAEAMTITPDGPMQSDGETAADSWSAKYTIWSRSISIPPRPLVEKATKAFFEGAAVIFELFSEAEKIDLFNDVYSATAGESSNIALCQLSAIAAVGCRYQPDAFSPNDGEAFMELSKSRLEECVEVAPLPAMRVFTLLCMYSTFGNRTAASLYLEMGLKLARVNKVDTFVAMPGFIIWKRTLNSLILLDCWLGGLMGYVAEDPNFELQRAVLGAVPEPDSLVDIVQLETTRIGYLTSLIRRDICFAPAVTPAVISNYKTQLETWLLSLPSFMRLDALLGQEPSSLSRSIFVVHLLYLSTTILMYRRVLVDQNERTLPLDSSGLAADTHEFVSLCLWYSRQAARLLGLARAQNLLIKKGMIFSYSAYCASSIILFFVANSLQSADAASMDSVAEDLEVAHQCVDVLEYCEMDDRPNQTLWEIRSLYHDLRNFVDSRLAGVGRDSSEEVGPPPSGTPLSHGKYKAGLNHQHGFSTTSSLSDLGENGVQAHLMLATRLLMQPFDGRERTQGAQRRGSFYVQ